MVWLETVEVHERMPKGLAKRLQKQREAMDRLRYNVQKVYPYAVTAAEVLKDVDYYLERMPDKKSRREYLDKIESLDRPQRE